MPDIWGLGRPVPSSDPDTSAAEVVPTYGASSFIPTPSAYNGTTVGVTASPSIVPYTGGVNVRLASQSAIAGWVLGLAIMVAGLIVF